jgi:hypothetical protein
MATQSDESCSIRRTDSGAIDMEYYDRHARHIRSQFVWNLAKKLIKGEVKSSNEPLTRMFHPGTG